MSYYYVYILQSDNNKQKFYIGRTKNLKARLLKHNSGANPSTKHNRPRRIKIYLAFTDEQQAREFVEYLKSPFGRAFSKKRL